MTSKIIVRTWDKVAKDYNSVSEMQPDYVANYYHLLSCLGDVNGRSILEVGSGTGLSSAYLVSKGAKVSLLDISKKALEFAKKHFISKKIRADFYLQDAFSMKFPVNNFDVVWNGGVIEHFSDSKKVLMIKKMWNLVKPGGKLLITTPNSRDYAFIFAKKILQFRKKWAFGFEDNISEKEMKVLAFKAGIDDFEIFAYNAVVGWWFFPYGREITNLLGLNKPKFHKTKTPFGHVLILTATKKK